MRIRELFQKYQEPILYVIFGTATTLVNWLVYVLLLHVLTYSAGNVLFTPLAVSNAIAWFVSVAFAFVVNKLFVFKSRGLKFSGVLREAVLFLGARVFSGIVEILGLPFLVTNGLDMEIFGIEGAAAKVVITIVVLILNYVFSKFAIFRKKERCE